MLYLPLEFPSPFHWAYQRSPLLKVLIVLISSSTALCNIWVFAWNINQDSQWPDSVKDTARKYSQFQDNKYPQIIRETALSAILNGEDNVVLDHLYNLAPEPLISFGDFPITKTKDRIAEENRFTDEVSKAELELKRALYRDAAEEFQQEINFF